MDTIRTKLRMTLVLVAVASLCSVISIARGANENQGKSGDKALGAVFDVRQYGAAACGDLP